MPAELSGELERELYNKDKSLWTILREIKQAAWEILSAPPIPWYTDHGKAHSERVAGHIFEILRPLREPDRLNGVELFVLLSACYLHDIGMWDLRLEGKTYPYSPNDYDEIRTRHPQRSAQIIRENTAYLLNPAKVINLKIPPDFLQEIMAVSEAHGSEFFGACVQELAQVTQKRGKPFRGPLLAALLLMADELDLEEIRSQGCFDPIASCLADYPVESILHIYRHHYITQVQILNDRGSAQIHLTFQFPPDSVNYANDIISWVASKLRQQCRRTQEIFAANRMGWDVKIKINWRPDHRHVRKPLPPAAIPHLQEITTFRKVVNREELIEFLKRYATGNFDFSQALLVYGNGDSDQETLAEWFLSACASRTEINWDYMDISSLETISPNDICERIGDLRSPDKSGIFVLCNLHLADIELKYWVLGPALEEMLTQPQASPLAVIMFADEDLRPLIRLQVTEKNLPDFNEEQVNRHLQEKLGCPEVQLPIARLGLNPGDHTPRYIVRMLENYQRTWVS